MLKADSNCTVQVGEKMKEVQVVTGQSKLNVSLLLHLLACFDLKLECSKVKKGMIRDVQKSSSDCLFSSLFKKKERGRSARGEKQMWTDFISSLSIKEDESCRGTWKEKG
jgi:hypothetical protein